MKVEKTMGKVLQIRNNVALMIILHVFSAGKISMPFIYLFICPNLVAPTLATEHSFASHIR